MKIGQPELVSFNEVHNKKLVNLEICQTFSKKTPEPSSIYLWSCLDILELLIEYSESNFSQLTPVGEYFLQIRKLFEFPMAKIPDILLCGLSQIRPKCGGPL